MNENFLRFKERLNKLLIIRSLMVGGAAGFGFGGLCLILAKLDILGFAPIWSLLIGILLFLTAGGTFYFLGRRSEADVARDLDARFDLKEKLQTMVAYENEQSDMIELQRQDADDSLAEIDINEYKIKGLWIYLTALCVSFAVLVAGFFVPNIWARNQNPPFSLSDYQIAGLEELIRYVEKSRMEDEFRVPMADELKELLADLHEVDNENDMRVELAEAMAAICHITYESSNATEMLDLLWDTDDRYLRYMAKWLDTSSWSSPDEGDYAERLVEYLYILLGEESDDSDGESDDEESVALTDEEKKANLAAVLDAMCRKIEIALDASVVPEDDEIYAAITALFFADDGAEHPGLLTVYTQMASLDYEQSRAAVTDTLYGIYDQMYQAISVQKINANVGEYTMTRLASLFPVPVPEFERPGFVKRGESVEGNKGDRGDDDDEGGNHDGGIGEGATFGSDDYVLDPLTGKYVKLGELIGRYYDLMDEKLENGSYTEEQKEIIRKYFALLYSGIKDEK